LEEPADTVNVTYSAGLSGNSLEFVASRGDSSINGTSGTVTVPQFSSPQNLLEATSLTSGDFEDTTEDSTPETTDVDLESDVALLDGNGNEIISTSETVTFTVSVNNLEGTVSVSGSANTDGS